MQSVYTTGLVNRAKYVFSRYQRIIKSRESLHCVVANVLDCDTVRSEFEIQSSYYIHLRTNTLWKDMKYLIPRILGEIIPLLPLCKDGFGNKEPKKVDVPLNKETETIIHYKIYWNGNKR